MTPSAIAVKTTWSSSPTKQLQTPLLDIEIHFDWKCKSWTHLLWTFISKMNVSLAFTARRASVFPRTSFIEPWFYRGKRTSSDRRVGLRKVTRAETYTNTERRSVGRVPSEFHQCPSRPDCSWRPSFSSERLSLTNPRIACRRIEFLLAEGKTSIRSSSHGRTLSAQSHQSCHQQAEFSKLGCTRGKADGQCTAGPLRIHDCYGREPIRHPNEVIEL